MRLTEGRKARAVEKIRSLPMALIQQGYLASALDLFSTGDMSEEELRATFEEEGQTALLDEFFNDDSEQPDSLQT